MVGRMLSKQVGGSSKSADSVASRWFDVPDSRSLSTGSLDDSGKGIQCGKLNIQGRYGAESADQGL